MTLRCAPLHFQQKAQSLSQPVNIHSPLPLKCCCRKNMGVHYRFHSLSLSFSGLTAIYKCSVCFLSTKSLSSISENEQRPMEKKNQACILYCDNSRKSTKCFPLPSKFRNYSPCPLLKQQLSGH